MAQLEIKLRGTEGALAKLRHRILKAASDAVGVVQLQQIDEAFRNQGQPGAKWPPLWAQSYQGPITQKSRAALQKASQALQKAKPAGYAKAKARFDKALANLKPAESYRKGGKALQDDGQLRASFHLRATRIFDTYAVVSVASSAFYAAYHQTGYRTAGPNFIPLSIAAKIGHRKGANPADEGFTYGEDYIMAWAGVDVPARPMVDYDDPANKAEIKQAIIDAVTHAARG